MPINDAELQKQLEKIAQFRAIDDVFFEVLADDAPFAKRYCAWMRYVGLATDVS